MSDYGVKIGIKADTGLTPEPDTQIQIHSGTYRHQKTTTNTHISPGLSHFGIN
jgi:hypothetical protein